MAPVLAPFEIAKTVAPEATDKAVSKVAKVPLVGNVAEGGLAASNILGDYATGNSSQGQADIQTAIHNGIPLLAAAAAPAVANFVTDNIGLPLSPEDLQFPSGNGKGAPKPTTTKGSSGGGGGAPRLPSEAPGASPALLLGAGGALLLLMKKR